MKPLSRLGLLLIVFGVSVLVASVPRASRTQLNTSAPLAYDQTMPLDLGVLPPSHFYLTFYSANSDVDFALLDQSAYNAWSHGQSFTAIWQEHNTTEGGALLNLPHRGTYYALVNDSDINGTLVSVVGTVYGYEADLVQLGIISVVAGIVLLPVSRIATRKGGAGEALKKI